MANVKTYTEITLDLLTRDSVSVLIKTYANINGEKLQVGDNTRAAYANSPIGRQQIEETLPEDYVASVFALWGDTPTVEDPKPPTVEESEE